MKSVFVHMVVMVMAWAAWAPGQEAAPPQLLVNPDFSLPLVNGLPPGWFKACVNIQAAGLDMGLNHDDKGSYLYLNQKNVQKNILNNWAQRLENPPQGKRLRLQAEVALEKVQGQGGVVLLMFFDKDGRMVGGVSSEGQVELTGTRPWTQVTLEADVPQEAHLGMVRIGISNGAGLIKARYARLYLLADSAPTPPAGATSAQAGLELLKNGSFEEGMMLGLPVGWFKAMIPDRTIHMEAGLTPIAGRGQVAFIKQEGVKMPLINNWAQRLETVPLGAKLKLTADVKTQDLPENTGFIMLQCWDQDNKLVGGATTQGNQPIGGSHDWKTVSIEVDVPVETKSIIVRCGLAQSGQIWFDNVSLKVISVPEAEQESPPAHERGFRVTDQTVAQLQRVQHLADELTQLATERIGPQGQVRREIFAQPDGTYEVVIHLALKED